MVVPQAGGVRAEGKVVHDPVHGQIALHPLLVKIIDTPEFQRLRSIKQLGGVSFVYPSGSHCRFEHSIGVAHLAGELANALKSRQAKLGITEEEILCVQIAGLCHDLGHGPFSHLYDNMFIPKVFKRTRNPIFETWKHEDASKKLFDKMVEDNGLKDEMKTYGLREDEMKNSWWIKKQKYDLTFIKEMMNPEGQDKRVWPFKGRGEEKSFLYEIVANKRNGLDVDKFDYLERDCHHLGLRNTFDYRRFFLFARVCKADGRLHICLREKELGNLYDMFYSRYSLHRRVYQHQVTKGVELMITDAFMKADPFLKLSDPVKDDNAEAYANLTDGVFDRILSSTETDEHMVAAKGILQNIHKRKLYECIGEAKEMDKESIEKLIDQLKLKAPGGEFEAVSFKYDFGKGEEDPLAKTYFYKKDKPDEAFLITEEEKNFLLPKKFCERMFRIYWKNPTEDEKKLKTLKDKFTTLSKEKRSFETQAPPEGGEN